MQDVLMRWVWGGSRIVMALALMLPLSVCAQETVALAEQQPQAEARLSDDTDAAVAATPAAKPAPAEANQVATEAAPTANAEAASTEARTELYALVEHAEAEEVDEDGESDEAGKSDESQVTGLPSVTHERLLQGTSNTADWLMYGGNYESWRFSPLTEIDRHNVKSCRLRGHFKRVFQPSSKPHQLSLTVCCI